MNLTRPDTIYVSIEKLSFLHEVIVNMPLIVTKDKNLSQQMEKVLNEMQKADLSSKIAAMGDQVKEAPSNINKHDPHLQKMLELIYVNIKRRFQVISNAFCYLDFKGREAVSLQDWVRGLDGFSIKILPRDSKLVFQYLTDSNAGSKVLMTNDQFMRLHNERKQRNIDPFELQVF